MPVVTEEDVLSGRKSISVRTRKGETKTIVVNALPWRTALQVSALLASAEAGAATIAAVQQSLLDMKGRDAFLDALVPEHLTWIATVAVQLSNGLDEAKKRTGSGSNSQPASETSSPSSAS